MRRWGAGGAVLRGDGFRISLSGTSIEDGIELLRHADESAALGEFLQSGGTNVSAAGTDATEDVESGAGDGAAVGNADGFTFGCAVLCNATGMLVHCGVRRHTVEDLNLEWTNKKRK